MAECSHVSCAIPLFLCGRLLRSSACSPRSPSAPGRPGKERYIPGGLGAPQPGVHPGMCSEAPGWLLKCENKPGSTLASGCPSPTPLSLQTNKQAVAMPALQPAGCHAGLSLPDHLPTGRPRASGPSSPCLGLGHDALLSPLELESSHLEIAHSQPQGSWEASPETCSSTCPDPL